MLDRLLIAIYTIPLFLLVHSASIAGTVGDINDDGWVDLTEAIFALQVSSGIYPNLNTSCQLTGQGDWITSVEYHECDVVNFDGSMQLKKMSSFT